MWRRASRFSGRPQARQPAAGAPRRLRRDAAPPPISPPRAARDGATTPRARRGRTRCGPSRRASSQLLRRRVRGRAARCRRAVPAPVQAEPARWRAAPCARASSRPPPPRPSPRAVGSSAPAAAPRSSPDAVAVPPRRRWCAPRVAVDAQRARRASRVGARASRGWTPAPPPAPPPHRPCSGRRGSRGLHAPRAAR